VHQRGGGKLWFLEIVAADYALVPPVSDTFSPAIGSFPFNQLTKARNATYQAYETCVVSNRIGLVKMDPMVTSEVYDHEESAPAVAEILEPQRPAENENKFQKAIAVWRGMYRVRPLRESIC